MQDMRVRVGDPKNFSPEHSRRDKIRYVSARSQRLLVRFDGLNGFSQPRKRRIHGRMPLPPGEP